jgi:hypothetical protein
MKPREHGAAYAAHLGGSGWQIVIPISGRLSPLVLRSNFPSKTAALEWLTSDAGGAFVSQAQRRRSLQDLAAPSETSSEKAISASARGAD